MHLATHSFIDFELACIPTPPQHTQDRGDASIEDSKKSKHMAALLGEEEEEEEELKAAPPMAPWTISGMLFGKGRKSSAADATGEARSPLVG